MTTPAWTIPQGIKFCPYCGGDTSIKVKENTAKVVCQNCDRRRNITLREYRAPRPCEICGHVRRVTIVQGASDNTARWEPLCSACQADRAAARHERAAQSFRARAQAIRAKRAGDPLAGDSFSRYSLARKSGA